MAVVLVMILVVVYGYVVVVVFLGGGRVSRLNLILSWWHGASWFWARRLL